MLYPCLCAALRFGNSSFKVDNGGLEGRVLGVRDWELRRLLQDVCGFAEGALPQTDRPAPENSCQAMQTHRRQSSLSRDGEFSKIQVDICSFALFMRKWRENEGFSATKRRAKKDKSSMYEFIG